MNDLEAWRSLLADPRRVGESLRERLDGDPKLADLRAELLAMDAEVRSVLTRPPVPEGLADRLVLGARYTERSRWRLGLAAAVAAAAIAAPILFGLEQHGAENAMIAHVNAEEAEWRDDRGVQADVLRASVAALGVEVRDAGYRIRHLANCVIDGREGRHFTVDGPGGVVTFVVLPGAKGSSPVLLERSGTRALFMKRAGNTIGVFARHGVDRFALERLLHQVFA